MPLPNLTKAISSQNWAQIITASVLEQGPIPKHIAFIMDGNRRFAKRHGIEVKEGHFLGGVALERILAACYDVGVEAVTVYAFSIENFKRPTEQVDAIWDILREIARADSSMRALLESHGARIGALGRLDLLPEDVRDSIEEMADDAQNRTQKVFNICVAYTSQDEITRAIRKSVTDYYEARITGALCSDQCITSQMLTDRMDTAGDLPVDLLVRTSGVYRLSDFLLWQCHQNTDIQIMDTLWPELELYDFWVMIMRWQRKILARETTLSSVLPNYDSKNVWSQMYMFPLLCSLCIILPLSGYCLL